MKHLRSFAAVLAVSLTSAALYAAPATPRDADGNGVVTKAEAMAKADARFAKMDANSDGVLNEADKAARVGKRFAAMDSDGNGSLSQAEFVAAQQARAEKRAERREKRMTRRGADGDMRGRGGRRGGGMKLLARADSNGDRAISQAEFRAAMEARFTRADANNDGTISAEERKTRRGKWRQSADAG